MTEGADESFTVSAPLWAWQSQNPGTTTWYFVTVDAQTAAEIRYAAMGRIGGFGSVRVTAQIGATVWQTSLFPHRHSGGLILPMKAAVRKQQGLAVGDQVDVMLSV